jgi:hypothetical protein
VSNDFSGLENVICSSLNLDGLEGLGLWYFTPLSTIFQLYRDGQFYWRREHNVASGTPRLRGVRTHNVSGGFWLDQL